jgi:hypothetical protein
MDQAFAELWHVPRAWVGERCFIIGGGESVAAQRDLIPRLRGRIIAIKRAVRLRPDADVLLLCALENMPMVARGLVPPATWHRTVVSEWLDAYTGGQVVVIDNFGRHAESVYRDAPQAKRLARDTDGSTLCDRPGHVVGHYAGLAAINLAYHFGAREIVLLGFDGFGGHWDEPVRYVASRQREAPEGRLTYFLGVEDFAADAKRKGLRIVNASPISWLTCFEHQPLETFLERSDPKNDGDEGRKSAADSTSDNADYPTLTQAKGLPAREPFRREAV